MNKNIPKIKKYKIITLQNEENNFDDISEFNHLLNLIRFIFVLEYDKTVSDEFSGSCTYCYKTKVLDSNLNDCYIEVGTYKVANLNYCIRISAWDNIKAYGFCYFIYDKLGNQYNSHRVCETMGYSNAEGATPITHLFKFLELIKKYDSFTTYEDFKKAKYEEERRLRDEEAKRLKEIEEKTKEINNINIEKKSESPEFPVFKNRTLIDYIKNLIAVFWRSKKNKS